MLRVSGLWKSSNSTWWVTITRQFGCMYLLTQDRHTTCWNYCTRHTTHSRDRRRHNTCWTWPSQNVYYLTACQSINIIILYLDYKEQSNIIHIIHVSCVTDYTIQMNNTFYNPIVVLLKQNITFHDVNYDRSVKSYLRLIPRTKVLYLNWIQNRTGSQLKLYCLQYFSVLFYNQFNYNKSIMSQ